MEYGDLTHYWGYFPGGFDLYVVECFCEETLNRDGYPNFQGWNWVPATGFLRKSVTFILPISPCFMKLQCYVVLMAVILYGTGCGSGTGSVDTEIESESQITGLADSVGILGYTSSGRVDKAIPAREDVTSGEITIAVDESFKPVIEAEIHAFEFLFPDAKVHALYLPGEEAIAAMLSSDSIRLAISTRELRPSEENFLAQRSIAPKYAHLFTDAIAVITHPDMDLKSLTMHQLQGLLDGSIRNWQELEPQSRNLEASLVVDNRASSVLITLRERFAHGEPLPQASLYALDSTQSVIDYVAENPGSIGFIGVAWISDLDDPDMRERKRKVTLVAMERSEGTDSTCLESENFFLPYQSYIYQGCYPLNRRVISVLRESTLGLGTGFVSYMDSPKGQLVVHKAGLPTVHSVSRRVKLPPKTKLDNSQ